MNPILVARPIRSGLFLFLAMLFASPVSATSFLVQCPNSTPLNPLVNAYGVAGQVDSTLPNPKIKCQEISGGDGYATMGDGHQIYLFGFGPLSGLADISAGLPGTQPASVFNNAADPNAAKSFPQDIMNTGVLFANQPAPLMAIDEGDEYFLTLSNVGMIMRPDLFEQHTVHFHGYPNASSYFDGVPDASVAIAIAGSMTYYYTAPDAGTYFWHCHITPPEHLQMGMVGQLYVRPRQNKVPDGADLGAALKQANLAAPGATDGVHCSDILCTGQTPLPMSAQRSGSGNSGVVQPVGGAKYAYNDGDGSTRYDVEYPIQMMDFDPNFHFVGMTFNPEAFADMKSKYFMLSGRSYPDTVNTNVVNTGVDAAGNPVPNGPMHTLDADGVSRPSQPLPTMIAINKSAGQTRALLRISDLSVTEFATLATIGIPMRVIAINARLLRDMAGNNMYYETNSITMGGGESMDVILDATNIPLGTYFLYSTNLDHLSNDAENFGGMMTEIVVQ